MSVAEIEAMETRRWAAQIGEDMEALDELFHTGLTYTHSNAIVEDRASYLNSIKNKVFDYRKADRSDTKIVVEGPTGVVTGRAQIAVVVGGQERALNARYIAVWVKVGDDWKFVAWESTSIPD